MIRNLRALGLGTVLGVAAAAMGCGWIIGLDEFTDQPPPGEDIDAGEEVGCSSSADCPTGEHGSASCEAGACSFACEDGFADCDETPGCETSTSADKSNCGGCGVTCSAYCEGSTCNDPVFIAAMRRHTCAVLKDGSVWCWGWNVGGALGDGTTIDRLTPTRVLLPGPAVQVAGAAGYGGNHTCALLADQTVACWGSNQFGELGDGSKDASSVPVPVSLPGVRQIATQQQATCALTLDDTLFCWGNIVPVAGGAPSPVEIVSSVASISMGGGHACLITTGGALQCWGSNSFGQLGIGPQGDQTAPVTVSGMADVIEVACGGLHTCARNGVGTRCWGNSSDGQLGLGDMTSHDLPQPLDLPSVELLALGFRHSSAIVNGGVRMWGRNNAGQLGDGTAVEELSPKDIGLNGVKMTALGEGHTCALTDVGLLLCWGDNGIGQLGDGTTISTSVPTPVVWP